MTAYNNKINNASLRAENRRQRNVQRLSSVQYRRDEIYAYKTEIEHDKKLANMRNEYTYVTKNK